MTEILDLKPGITTTLGISRERHEREPNVSAKVEGSYHPLAAPTSVRTRVGRMRPPLQKWLTEAQIGQGLRPRDLSRSLGWPWLDAEIVRAALRAICP